MTKVLLDACIPQWLRHELSSFDVVTASYAGLDEIPDGAVLDAMADRFDVLITLDRNLTYQQKIASRRVAIIVLRVVDQSPASFLALVPALHSAISQAKVGTVTYIAE